MLRCAMPYKDPADRLAWRARNKDKVAASNVRVYQRRCGTPVPHPCEWAHETPEQLKERARLRYLKSSRKRQAKGYFREWWASKGRAYRADRSNAHRDRSRPTGSIERLFVAQAGTCNGCKKLLDDTWHLDHIQPLARGGRHIEGNLQILCAPCNRKKGVKSMAEAF
jgi:5-methylcytosine-specific restriction endonuclease McrA